jgi:Transposase and inactivated derivatives
MDPTLRARVREALASLRQTCWHFWRVDETYIRVRGRWNYLYRAVDKQGKTVDFLLSEKRDIVAAKRFFSRAIRRHGTRQSITLDGYPATDSAVDELKKDGVLRPETKVWTSKYLNNIIEQNHRRVKQRVYPMLGFKNFKNATITMSGIELTQKIRKGQFNIAELMKVQMPQVWDAVPGA